VERRLAAILAADVAGYSRMMSEDEAGTLAALQGHRSSLIDPVIARHRGRIVKLMGDGILAEFASVVEAVECAAEIQRGMAERNAGRPADRQMMFRIGLHLGDVLVDGDDLYGEGVNVASRLEGIAEKGGIAISRQAFEQVERKLKLGYRKLGPQKLKNIPNPVDVYALSVDGSGFVDERQEIRYCRGPDGTRLAYALSGAGSPLVKTGNWLNHIEYDWESPVWYDFLHGLSRRYTLIRYDARGNGLSDWDVADLSFEAWLSDLETVADAVNIERFPLLGVSQGCAISIAYAARRPERVSHLVLYGGFAVGANKRSPEERAKREALGTLMRLEWGSNSPALRQMFGMQFMPEAPKELLDAFSELQRRSTSPESAARYYAATGDFDVTGYLGQVKAPTLVMHARGDLRVPVALGRQMAAGIPGARFVALPSPNHILLSGEPALARFFEELDIFLAK
jgi:class 3 adenylate cyclase/pimeloyl-ACP methyl ester carboxylesterase